MANEIPYSRWQPLSVGEVMRLFAGAPFVWALAGGHAVEQFVGKPIREHDDIDVLVFRVDQLHCQQWLAGWDLFAADPPGTLRPWLSGEQLPIGIHDIWGHRVGSEAWELQLMLAETEGDEWFSRRSPLIRGWREDLFVNYNGLPCLRVEVQLLYKAKSARPKDEVDFQAALPLLSGDAREWLRRNLWLAHPEGHAWIDRLT
jgi:hypothetical protein